LLTHFIKELVQLPAVEVDEPVKREKGWVFPLRFRPDPTCPTCGQKSWRKRRFTRVLRHGWTSTLGFFYVEVPSERRFCPSCDSTFIRRPPGIPERGSVTEAFRHFAVSCCHGRSIQSVSRQLRIAYTTLERWFYDDLAPVESPPARRVGVDDFALRKGHSYGVCTLDLDTKQVLGVCEGRKETDIRGLLQRTAQQAQVVVSDAAPAMSKAIQNACPQARHVLDRFHLIQFFTDSMKQRRKMTSLGRSPHGETRHALRLLTTQPERLTDEERREVRERLRVDEALKGRYQALQHFRYVLKSPVLSVARQRLDAWLKRFSFHPISAVRRLVKTVSARKEGVLAAAVCPESNGPLEGINTKVKLLKRRAYGYRNLAHFMHRIRLETGQASVKDNLW